MKLELVLLFCGESVEQVGGEILLVAAVILAGHQTCSANRARIFSIPSRIRPFTVPSGIPSMSAICEWVSPPK